MSNYNHIIDDGFLDELDIEVEWGDPQHYELIYPKFLREMETPSRVEPFTVEQVVECLGEAAEETRKMLEDYFQNLDIEKQIEEWMANESIRDIKFLSLNGFKK